MQIPKHATRQALDAYILTIRRQSNTLVPIARLPPEILSRVFYECVQLSDSTTGESLWTLWWIKATHVCHHWRAVFLSTPTLWGDVTLSSRVSGEPMQEWLARSQGTLIEVKINEPRSSLPPTRIKQLILDPLLDVWPRVRLLRLSLPQSIVDSMKWPHFISLSLEHLVLYGSAVGSRPRNRPNLAAAFPRTLKERFPCLKTLSTHGHLFDFKTWSLPTSLTTLNVLNRVAPSQKTVTLAETVHALQQLTSLNELSLDYALPEDTTADWPTTESISLPSLQTLKLCGSARLHAWLLNILDFPSTTQLKLSLSIDNGYPAIDIPTLSSISACLGRLGPLRSAIILVEGGHGWSWRHDAFSFKAWREVQSAEHMDEAAHTTSADFNLSFTLKEGQSAGGWAGLEPLLITFPHSHTQILTIICDEGSFFFSVPVYGRMNQVHTLSLIGTGELHTSGTLLLDLLDACEYAGRAIFPKLRFLHATYVDFSVVLDRLQAVLRRFHANDQPLKVVLRSCYRLNDEIIEDLKHLADIDWDGEMLEPTESSDEELDDEEESEEDSDSDDYDEYDGYPAAITYIPVY